MSVNHLAEQDNVFDAYESMLYHELMNNLNFISFPDDITPSKELLSLTKFSGIQIYNFLQTIRFIKMFEKGELIEQIYEVQCDEVINSITSKLVPLSNPRNQKIIHNLNDSLNVFSEQLLLELFWFNLLSVALKFSPNNQNINIFNSSNDNQYVEFNVCFSFIEHLGFPTNLMCDNLENALLKNNGYERTLALRILFFNYVLSPHDSVFNVEVENKLTCFKFKMKNANYHKEYQKCNKIAFNIPVIDEKYSETLSLILMEIKQTPSYKVSKLYDLANSIFRKCSCEETNNVALAIKTFLDLGKFDELYRYIDSILSPDN